MDTAAKAEIAEAILKTVTIWESRYAGRNPETCIACWHGAVKEAVVALAREAGDATKPDEDLQLIVFAMCCSGIGHVQAWVQAWAESISRTSEKV